MHTPFASISISCLGGSRFNKAGPYVETCRISTDIGFWLPSAGVIAELKTCLSCYFDPPIISLINFYYSTGTLLQYRHLRHGTKFPWISLSMHLVKGPSVTDVTKIRQIYSQYLPVSCYHQIISKSALPFTRSRFVNVLICIKVILVFLTFWASELSSQVINEKCVNR